MIKFGVLLVLSALSLQAQTAEVLSLLEVLKMAENYDPRLQSDRFRETAAEENIRVQRSSYLPSLSVAAVGSTGNPGSFSIMNVDSDLSTANRIGLGGAFILKQDIWDFGRTSGAVRTAEVQRDLQRQQVALSRLEVDRDLLRTYLSCSFLRAELENSKFMADQAHLMARETERFVRAGQRSIVERYLVDAEAKEAETRIAEFTERVADTELRLAIELGRTGRVSCVDLNSTAKALDDLGRNRGNNPILEAQKTRLEMARSRFAQARAEGHPAIFGMATGGYFDNDNLHEKWNYAAGVGIQLPLFEGFRIDATINRQAADLHAQESDLESSQLGVTRINSQLQEQISSLNVRLEFLERERKLGYEVLGLAKKRYLNLQGTMIDLRESIRNLKRILQTSDETSRDLLTARGEMALINGARN